jgi:hypothetical protein
MTASTILFIPDFVTATERHERKVPYSGTAVRSLSLVCKAENMAAGGFWRGTNGRIEEGARFEQEPKPTFWKISLSKDGTAQVIRVNANSEEIESPKLFSVEVTPGEGLLLLPADRLSGTSPETISIDLDNSSFVYSSQHVNQMWNRANIWYGSCRSDWSP